MPYTNATFDPAVPTGSSQASGGDDSIRAAKLDLKERLETFFEDIDDDPLVPIAGVLGGVGAKVGKVMSIPFAAFQGARVDEDSLIFQDAYLQSHDNGSRALYAPLILPAGVTITKVEALWDQRGNGGIQLEVMRTLFSLATQSTIITLAESGGGGSPTLTASGVLSQVISGLFYYNLKVSPTGAVGGEPIFIYGVRITYDADDATETL